MKKITVLAVAVLLSIGTSAYANSLTDWNKLTPAQQRAVEKSALANNAKSNKNCQPCHGGGLDGTRDDLRYDNDGDLIENSR